jgi:hypothetical protein
MSVITPRVTDTRSQDVARPGGWIAAHTSLGEQAGQLVPLGTFLKSGTRSAGATAAQADRRWLIEPDVRDATIHIERRPSKLAGRMDADGFAKSRSGHLDADHLPEGRLGNDPYSVFTSLSCLLGGGVGIGDDQDVELAGHSR